MWWSRGGSERGSVAVTVALTITLLLGFAALVVDIGLNWAARTSAQTAADSASLAGASRLVADGGAAALLTVEQGLTDNGITLPGAANWASDGNEANGEVVCWTLPAGPPGAGASCPDGSNALQVTTPAIQVEYAFAAVLGEGSRSIKARAAAAAGPAAPNNCALCVLDLDDDAALAATNVGGIEVLPGGGIVVNSDNPGAVLLTNGPNVSADQIRVVGGIDLPIGGTLVPPAEQGGPPVPDPLADLLPPNDLAFPPAPDATPARDIDTDTTLSPGVYEHITVHDGATLTLQEGIYVVTDFDLVDTGFRVLDGGRVESTGDGVTIYLACQDYPAPCDGDAGARFRLDPLSELEVSAPSTGEYAGLSIFADPGNTRSQQLRGPVNLPGAVYAASARLVLFPTADVQVDSLVVVDRLTAGNALAPLRVDYDPSLDIFGYGVPVLVS